MRRIWLVFWHTYWGHVTRKGYLLFTIGLPVYIVGAPLIGGLIMALAIRSALPPTSPLPVGVIDQSGLLADPEAYLDIPVAMLAFDSEAAAAAALEAGDIQAYYDIKPDYWESGAIILTYDQAPSDEVRGMFMRWLRGQVRDKVPPDLLARYNAGANIVHRDLSSTRSYSESDTLEWVLVFMLIYFARVGSSFTAGYMYDSIASEARDRTIEILITSVSPLQFVISKLLGLLAVGMTQLVTWGGMLLLLAAGGAALSGFDMLGFLLSWQYLGLLTSVMVAAYVLDQVIAAAAGMLRVSGGAGPQLFNIVTWIMGLALLYAAIFVPRHPDAPLAVAATFFPFTMPIVLPIRVIASDVPTWQVVVSQVLMWLTIVASVLPLRWLLRLNLVSYAPRFNSLRWLKARLTGLWRGASKVTTGG